MTFCNSIFTIVETEQSTSGVFHHTLWPLMWQTLYALLSLIAVFFWKGLVLHLSGKVIPFDLHNSALEWLIAEVHVCKLPVFQKIKYGQLLFTDVKDSLFYYTLFVKFLFSGYYTNTTNKSSS